MFETVLTYLIGLIGGIAVGIQSPIAGAISGRVGGAASSLIIHVGGAILSAILLAARGGENIAAWRSLPAYMLGAGVFGLILYLTLDHSIPRLGAGTAVTLLIVGQLLTGVVIDHFGLLGVAVRPIDPTRLVAVGFLFIGAYLLVR